MQAAGTPATAIAFALAFGVAVLLLLGGLAARVLLYARTPVPLKIPTTPAPRTRAGVVLRMAREVLLFESLFRGTLWTWIFAWMFHFGMALALLRHLRYFTQPVWEWVAWVQPLGKYAGAAMAAGLCGLWVRRWFVARVRFISTPSDHLMLALLLGIAASGLSMTFLVHTDVVAVKAFALGLLHLEAAPLPAGVLFVLHLGLVGLLAAVFPFSKLLHAPGVFFSPTRNQTNDTRERRHAPAASRA